MSLKHLCVVLCTPHETYLSRFQGLSEVANLDFSITIETTTLDAFCQQEKIEEIDFLQTDVQGADLDVLHGAINLLNKSILAIQIEVIFSPLYINQPLFSDVDVFLRNQKFSLFDIFLAHRPRHILNEKSRKHPNGQLLWGDAFYLRDLISENYAEEKISPVKLLKLACVADVLGFYDYALELLIYLTNNYGDNPEYNFSFLGDGM